MTAFNKNQMRTYHTSLEINNDVARVLFYSMAMNSETESLKLTYYPG